MCWQNAYTIGLFFRKRKKKCHSFCDECLDGMADKFFLVVADYNPDAKRFYERNGYQQVGEIPNLYRSGVTEYMMAKDLKSD